MDTTEIKKAIQLYFDGAYEGNGDKIAEVFHDAAHVYGHAEDGSLADTPKDAFVSRVASRPADAPAFPREDEILSIDFISEDTAVVRIKIRVHSRRFTDILCFMKLNGKWCIISKVFSGETIE
jgi:hypothetical protein